jgi:hypothetical protein
MTDEQKDITFEDINDEYCYCKYMEFNVIMMKKNGYINATKMCQDISEETGSKKPFRNWKENKNANEILSNMSTELNITQKELMYVITTSAPKKAIICGTYVHPILITHIAMWCSPSFAVKISLFVEEWRKLNHVNELQYWKALAEAKPSSNDMQERKIQEELCKKLKGKQEVETVCGYIDILTDYQIIEIKHISEYKHALGQILMYAHEYPKHGKVICLFGKDDNVNIDVVKDIYSEYDVELFIYKIELITI